MGKLVDTHLRDLSKGLKADGTGKGFAAFVNEFMVTNILSTGETLTTPRARVLTDK